MNSFTTPFLLSSIPTCICFHSYFDKYAPRHFPLLPSSQQLNTELILAPLSQFRIHIGHFTHPESLARWHKLMFVTNTSKMVTVSLTLLTGPGKQAAESCRMLKSTVNKLTAPLQAVVAMLQNAAFSLSEDSHSD